MLEALAINAGVTLALALVCWVISLVVDEVSFVDSVWGGAMALLALTSMAQMGEPGPIALLITCMTVIWGVRLALHLFLRYRRNGEDERYQRILVEDRKKGRFWWGSLTTVWLFQALLLFLVCLPAQLGILGADWQDDIGILGWSGLVLWLIGIAFEWIGDWQLARFKADPANAGKLMTSGLFAYTRHPNYFGDFCVWWGIWLACADVDPMLALYSLPGPLFLSFTLIKWSGVGLTERAMREKYGEEFAAYAKRTSAFCPSLPR